MKLGTLVAKRYRWEIESRDLGLGIIVDESKAIPGAWIVLWTIKGSDSQYRIKEHLASALVDLNDIETKIENEEI